MKHTMGSIMEISIQHQKVFFSLSVCVQQVSPKIRNESTHCKTLISSINFFHWDLSSFPFESETEKEDKTEQTKQIKVGHTFF